MRSTPTGNYLHIGVLKAVIAVESVVKHFPGLKWHINEMKGSIQRRIDLLVFGACQTTVAAISPF